VYAAHERRGAVLFVDILGASPAMMRASPREVAARAARFFVDLEATVDTYGGVVDKFLGDGALIWFEQTRSGGGNEARAALRCALDLRERGTGHGRGGLRQGLHYGRVGAATVRRTHGARAELFGHTLNAAKRLEQATRRLDARLLVSDDAVRAGGVDGATLGLRRLARPLGLRGCRALTAWAG
jgi:adenylate cyclase